MRQQTGGVHRLRAKRPDGQMSIHAYGTVTYTVVYMPSFP